MADFLWKKVSDAERESIRKEAEGIMERFASKLNKVKIDFKISDAENESSERDEGSVEKCEIDRKIMFDNAPRKNDDSIIAERGSW